MRVQITAGLAVAAAACAPPSPQPQPNEMEQVVNATRYEGPAVAGTVGNVTYPEGPVTPAERDSIHDVERRTPQQVVETYATLLDAGNFEDAYLLWDTDSLGLSQEQFAAMFDRFETIDAAVGEMERIGGAAGSLYGEVQLTLTGTMEDGSHYSLTGPVTLRRANEVPGATEEQLNWRIVRTALTSRPEVAEKLVEQ